MIGLIRKGMEAGKYANSVTFMSEFGISRPTAMRDLDELRDDEGAPIEVDTAFARPCGACATGGPATAPWLAGLLILLGWRRNP